MRRLVALAAGLVPLALLLLVPVPKASAFPLTTCTLTITSRDMTGGVIDTASDGDAIGSTKDNPLLVDPHGIIEWTASTGGATQGTYHVDIYGVPTPLSGSVDPKSQTNLSGSFNMAEILPFDIVGIAYVSGSLDDSNGAHCSGSGWIKLRGDPVGTPGFVAGVAMSLLGVASLFASLRGRHPILGAVAGLIGGAGLALLSGVTGILPLDERTPIAEVVGMIITGLVIGTIKFGSLWHGGATEVNRVDAAALAAAAGGGAAGAAAGAGGTGTGSSEAGPLWVDSPNPPWAPPNPPVAPVTPPVAPTPPAPPDLSGNTGYTEINKWKESLPPVQQKILDPLFPGAEAILGGHPGTFTIGSSVVDGFLKTANAPLSVELGDGAITVAGVVDAVPSVQNGKVAVSFAEDPISKVAGGLAGAAGGLDGLKWFVDQINSAVAQSGQHITGVSVTPGGISITTAR
jgi:hypothetical protein